MLRKFWRGKDCLQLKAWLWFCLWDSLSIWGKGLGVFDAWVCAGVHGLGLWVKSEGSLLHLPILNSIGKGLSSLETHIGQTCSSALEHGLTYVKVLPLFRCDVG